MKKRTLRTKLLIPVILIVITFPLLSCMVFHQAAKQYGYTNAVNDLEQLQKNIVPVVRNSFGTGNRETGLGASAAENVRSFLEQAGLLAKRTGGSAQMMILGSEMQVIYPREEEEREALSPLADSFARYIEQNGIVFTENAVEITAPTGEIFLVCVYEIPTKSVQLKYLITYCSTAGFDEWLRSGTMLVLLISAILAAIAAVCLLLLARTVTKPLAQIGEVARQIGNGSFITDENPYSVVELDDLRHSVNKMSEQLDESSRAQRDFLQNVSHELRNPLMSIGGYAQGIEQQVFDPAQAAHTIMEESARLTEMVNSLLTLSRLEADNQPVKCEPIRLGELIQDHMDRLAGLAHQSKKELILQPFAQAFSAVCNEELFGQILDNLLTNAIRYAEKTVMISVTSSGQVVNITIQDDGEGIDEKDYPHIFERCYKGKGGNHGLGLAIARSAAEKMGGELSAANLSRGAAFTLTLNAE